MVRWIAAIGLCLFAAITATAQATPDGIVLGRQGQLYTYSPAAGLVALATGGTVTDVHVSPSGRYVSYLQIIPGDGSAHNATGDYVVLDLASEDRTQITPTLTNYPIRRGGTFSPDGSQIAWAEFDNDDTRIMVHDLTTNETRILTEHFALGFQDGGLSLPTITWGPGGIAYQVGSMSGTQLYLVTPDGGVQSLSPRFPQGTFASLVGWADDNLLLLRGGEIWYALDLSTQRILTPQPPEAATLLLDNDVTITANNVNGWQRVDGTGAVFGPYTPHPWSPAPMAVIGNTLIYIDDTLQQMDLTTGETTEISPETDWQLYPTGQSWRVGTANTTDVGPVVSSTCALPAQLPAGQPARVVRGLGANTVREQPSTNAERVGEIPDGASFYVFARADNTCSDGFIWYRVLYNGVEGWTAAGDGSTMTNWLEPSTEAPRTCPASQPTRIAGTRTVRALVDINTERGSNSDFIPAGTVFTLESGEPECNDAGQTTFWAYGDTAIGRVIEADATAYFIEPVTE